MFSLLITVVAIALVAALLLATIYYVGDTSKTAVPRVAATSVVSEAQQIAAAGYLAVSDGVGWPDGAPQFVAPYLSTMPVPPASAYAPGLVPSAADWQYYEAGAHQLALLNKISTAACFAINKTSGLVGIPATITSAAVAQCFGLAEPYTFIYSTTDTTTDQAVSAMATSVAAANTILATSPVQVASTDSVSPTLSALAQVTDPGYPVLCPSGNYINSGACSDVMPDNSMVTAESAGGAAASVSMFNCNNQSPMIDTNGYSWPGDTSPDVYIAITGPGADAEFGNITTANITSDFPQLTSTATVQQMSNGLRYVQLVLGPGPHAPGDNLTYVINGASGQTVTCYQTVVASLSSATPAPTMTMQTTGTDAAGGFKATLTATNGTSFVVGPHGEKPVVYWYDALIPASNIAMIDSQTLKINSVPSFAAAGGYGAANYEWVAVENYGSANTGWIQFDYTNTPAAPVPPPPFHVDADTSPWKGYIAGGDTVTITGQFDGTETVNFGGVNAPVVSRTSTSLQVVSPAVSNWGSVNIAVTQASSGNMNNTSFYYVLNTPAVFVSGFSPSSGSTAGGTVVTLTGQNFTQWSTVTLLNSQGATAGTGQIVSWSPTQLTFKTPAGTGAVQFQVSDPSNRTNSMIGDWFNYVP